MFNAIELAVVPLLRPLFPSLGGLLLSSSVDAALPHSFHSGKTRTSPSMRSQVAFVVAFSAALSVFAAPATLPWCVRRPPLDSGWRS